MKYNPHMSSFSFIDLFAGPGGLSLGFDTAGFRCISAFDSDKYAIETYRKNFDDHIHHEEITENISLKTPDVIIGGPPCQGFSSAGARRSDDKRNTLVSVFSKLIVRYKPRAFVFENVEGFLTANNGDRVFDLIDPLVTAGYKIHLRKINTANYGVPQLRKRVIALGGLGWDPSFPEPTHMAFGAPGASNSFRHLPNCPSLNDALQNLPLAKKEPPGIPQGHFSYPVSDEYLLRIERLEQGQTMKDLPEELWHSSYHRRSHRRVRDGTPTERRGGPPAGLRRLRSDQPSKAITSGSIRDFVHPTENRFLTIRECARIQTFPDHFEFAGSATACIQQIGNAVPPVLSEIIASHMKKGLLKSQKLASTDTGELLTFQPTTSTGVSPALKFVLDRINRKYFESQNAILEQQNLWH